MARPANSWSAGDKLNASDLNANFSEIWDDLMGKRIEETFNSDGTWDKPDDAKIVKVEVWGGGGSGGAALSNSGMASGGGGGAYNKKIFSADELGSSESVTVGSGGAAVSISQNGDNYSHGNSGGKSEFGNALVEAYGGGRGAGSSMSNYVSAGGGGGGRSAVGADGSAGSGSVTNVRLREGGDFHPLSGMGLTGRRFQNNLNWETDFQNTTDARIIVRTFVSGIWSGAGGGADGDLNLVFAGGDAGWGGAGGGAAEGYTTGTYSSGGTSIYGGDGGSGNVGDDTGDVSATDGSAPGGGGGGAVNKDAANGSATSGAGGDGKVVVTTYY